MIEFITYQMRQSSETAHHYASGASRFYNDVYLRHNSAAREFFLTSLINYPSQLPTMYPHLGTGDQAPHAKRREYFDAIHAEEFVAKNLITAKPRSQLKPGQVAFVHLGSMRGDTTLPSGYKFWVQLVRPSALHPDGSYWAVKVLYSTQSHYWGRTFRVGRSSMARVDFDDSDATLTKNFRNIAKEFTQEWARKSKDNRYYSLRQKFESRLECYVQDPRFNHIGSYTKYQNMFGNHTPSASNFVDWCNLVRRDWAYGQVERWAYSYLRDAAAHPDGLYGATVETLFNTDINEAFRAFGLSPTSDRARLLRNRVKDYIRVKYGLTNLHPDAHTNGCSHWHREHVNVAGHSYCGDCAARYRSSGDIVTAINREGREVEVFSHSVYYHPDGKIYTYAPPPIIGSYHSSKNVHTQPLPLLTGKPIPADTLKLGYELEFDAHDRRTKDDNALAGELKARLAGVQSKLGQQPYACFERDSSVWFEMVSGYGDISVHREALRDMLDTDQFDGQLKSHDGGRCGLHVHLDCPKSISHALKLTAFYNADHNELLLSTVARRYAGTRFAVIAQNRYKAKSDWKSTARYMSRMRKHDGYSHNEALEAAMHGMANSRYDAVNWENAPRTVEIRIFRGSMVLESVLACLEFAYLSWYFTRDTPDTKLTTQEFLKFISSTQWRGDSKYLRAYLAKRGFQGIWLANTKPLDEDDHPFSKEITDESDTEYVKKYNHRVQQRRARMAMVQAA